MKVVSTLPLIFLVACSAWAQHGAPAGHAGGSFSSGRSFSMSSPGYSRSSSSVPAYRPNLAAPSRALYSRPVYSSPIGPPLFGGTQPNPGRRYPYPTSGYRPYYRGAYIYPTYLGYGGFYGYAGYPDDSSYDQPQPAPAYQDVNAQAPPDSGYYDQAYTPAPPSRPAYQPQAPAPPAVPDQPEITLLFKDGRPPQQVQNYAVTRTTLYVLDGERRREIPLDEIDLAQTEKTNRDAGLDFEIPAGAE